MSDIGRYITLLQKVETAYPNWSTSILIDNLRATGPLDSSQFQQILGTAPGIEIPPKNPLTLSDRNELRAIISHDTASNEIGISLDQSTGRQVALGHVIVGISSGIHHPAPLIYYDIGPVHIATPDISVSKQRLGLDPLYATTVTGDLGSTVVLPNKRYDTGYKPFGGVGTEATAAELNGDIDGFLLGYWLSATANGQTIRTAMIQGNSVKLSTMLAEYYRIRTDRPIGMVAGSNYPLESIRRFTNFNKTFQYLYQTFADQTVLFNRYWALNKMAVPNPEEALRVMSDFEQWCLNGGI